MQKNRLAHWNNPIGQGDFDLHKRFYKNLHSKEQRKEVAMAVWKITDASGAPICGVCVKELVNVAQCIAVQTVTDVQGVTQFDTQSDFVVVQKEGRFDLLILAMGANIRCTLQPHGKMK